jgi:hypothetical protein
MKLLLMMSISMLVFGGVSHGDDLPNLFKSEKFTTKDVYDAVNIYQKMGEKQAVINLISVGWDSSSVKKQKFSTQERAFWIASLLYAPRDPSGKMYIGGLSLPPIKNKYLDWYYYPLIEIDGLYFVLAEGISGAGVPIGIVDYIAGCQQWGTFRENQLKIVNVKQSGEKLEGFFASKKWLDLYSKDDLFSQRQKSEIENFMRSQIATE